MIVGLSRAAEIWSALSARPPFPEEAAALLPEPGDSATLVEIARLALRSDAYATGPYLHAVLDRLPSSLLHELAERAVHRLTSGPNDAAEEVIAYVSVHQAESLAAHLPALWELSPNEGFYFAEWPWRAADDSEIARLWEHADPDGGLRCDQALRCLLQTRRPDVLARLSPPEDDLHSVGYARSSGGELRRLHSASPWHLAFPADLHRVGGEPTWIQEPDYPSCPDCADTMIAAGQISVADLWDFEGMCYLMWCDQCAISGIVYQQT